MTEKFKEAIRQIIYFWSVATGSDGEFYAESGSWKYKFFMWLYGDAEEYHDGWIYPE